MKPLNYHDELSPILGEGTTDGESSLSPSSKVEDNSPYSSSGLSKKCFVLSVIAGMILCSGLALHGRMIGTNKFSGGTCPSSDPSPVPSYRTFQGIGLQIYTGGAPAFLSRDDGTNATRHNPECTKIRSYGHMDGDLQCYVGLPDSREDVRRRLDVMRTAVDAAYDLASDNPTTLKVFVAPEFFWRGRNGAYAFDSEAEEQDRRNGGCGVVCEILSGLEAIVEDERFVDWVFLFGTVIASERLPTDDPFDYLFYNFAPLYKGGPASTEGGKRFLVPKRFVSNMDFLTPSRSFNTSFTMELIDKGVPIITDQVSTVLNPYEHKSYNYDSTMWETYKDELHELGYEMIEFAWFILDGITFTCEICVDHLARRALTTYLANAASFSETLIPSASKDGLKFVKIPTHQAQISLVASAGMSVNIDSLALAEKGTILLQDGLDQTPSNYSWINKRLHTLEYDGGSEVVSRRAVLTRTDAFFEYKLNEAYVSYPVFTNASKPWSEALNGIFTKEKYEPLLTLYDPIEITRK